MIILSNKSLQAVQKVSLGKEVLAGDFWLKCQGQWVLGSFAIILIILLCGKNAEDQQSLDVVLKVNF